MKVTVASMLFLVFVYAELPPNSYLPPPPSNRPTGYPQGSSAASQSFIPQIIAARTLGAQNTRNSAPGALSPQGNAFGRSSQGALSQDHIAGYASSRFTNEETAGYDANAANFARNALEESKSEPANYNFGYMVNDYQEGTDFGHHEERQEERAQGEYHVVLPDGRKQIVSYEADERGFKPQISYEDSEDLARSSGYDSNANNVRSSNTDGHFGSNGGHDSFSRSNGY